MASEETSDQVPVHYISGGPSSKLTRGRKGLDGGTRSLIQDLLRPSKRGGTRKTATSVFLVPLPERKGGSA